MASWSCSNSYSIVRDFSVTSSTSAPIPGDWPQNEILPPLRTWVADGNLCWTGGLFARVPKRSFQRPYLRPDVTLLGDFVRLADANDMAIAAFAERFGALYLCKKHRRPSAHAPGEELKAVVLDYSAPKIDINAVLQGGFNNRCPLDTQVTEEEGVFYVEPLARWRHYAREAKATLKIVSELHRGRIGSLADWDAFHGRPARTLPDLNTARAVVMDRVDRWMTEGRVQPSMCWHSDRVEVVFGNGTLFGALAVQLLSSVAKRATFVTCSECAAIYAPRRQPRADRRNYCPACNESGIPARNRKRDERERKQVNRSANATRPD